MTEYNATAYCAYCGKQFNCSNRRHKYCSSNCKEAARIARLEIHEGTCLGCGKPIKYKLNGGKPTRRYCSFSCQLAHTVPDKVCTCVDCGAQFIFHGRCTKQRCETCDKKHVSERHMRNRARKDPTIKLGVGSGGSQNNDHVYDSTEHTMSLVRKRKYYAEHIDDMRAAARARYRSILTGNDSCEVCGYDKHQDALVVHHKNMNRKDNDRTNLVILCSNCHAVLHKLIRREQKVEQVTAVAVFNKFKEAESKSRNEAGKPCKGQSEPKADSNDGQGQRIPAGPEKDISRHEAATEQ